MGTDQMSAVDPEVPLDAVGRRVSCDGERATVRFVGTVPPTKGLWLGVEWDNPERGKHDGTHEGVQYFTCRHPSGGSFVRPRKASFGVDYVTAIRELSSSAGQDVPEEDVDETISVFVKRLKSMQVVTLRKKDVCGSSVSGDDIRAVTPDVCSLDLGATLLSSWDDVANITQHLDHLQQLLLCDNRLRVPSDPLAQQHAFPSLKILSLQNCALSWPQLLQCAPLWPHLEELYVKNNNITQLQRPPGGVLETLKMLDLSYNQLTEDTVLSLAHLPRLEYLNLSRTGLSVLQFTDVPHGSKTDMFPVLNTLLLNHNNITEWSVVNELDKLRSLQELSFRFNPLLSRERNHQTADLLLLARLGQISTLNKCEITHEDRRGAELMYIKMFGEAWLKAGGQRDAEQSRPSMQFTSEHPRFHCLINKYGAPEESELKKQQPFALKNQLLNITFVCPDEADRKPIVKKLPDSMIVQKVKGLLYRLLKVPGTQIQLSYTNSKIEGTEIEIDNDLKSLQFYSIEDGDTVLVRWA